MSPGDLKILDFLSRDCWYGEVRVNLQTAEAKEVKNFFIEIMEQFSVLQVMQALRGWKETEKADRNLDKQREDWHKQTWRLTGGIEGIVSKCRTNQ